LAQAFGKTMTIYHHKQVMYFAYAYSLLISSMRYHEVIRFRVGG